MAVRQTITCDGPGCSATCAPELELAPGWSKLELRHVRFTTSPLERDREVVARKLDVCPICHARTLLEFIPPTRLQQQLEASQRIERVRRAGLELEQAREIEDAARAARAAVSKAIGEDDDKG